MITEKMVLETNEGVITLDKKKKDKMKNKLTTTQEVLYGREFRMADRAGGFGDHKR